MYYNLERKFKTISFEWPMNFKGIPLSLETSEIIYVNKNLLASHPFREIFLMGFTVLLPVLCNRKIEFSDYFHFEVNIFTGIIQFLHAVVVTKNNVNIHNIVNAVNLVRLSVENIFEYRNIDLRICSIQKSGNPEKFYCTINIFVNDE